MSRSGTYDMKYGFILDDDASFPISIEDVTGVIGEWLDKDMSNIPNEAVSHIVEAYKICVKEL